MSAVDDVILGIRAAVHASRLERAARAGRRNVVYLIGGKYEARMRPPNGARLGPARIFILPAGRPHSGRKRNRVSRLEDTTST